MSIISTLRRILNDTPGTATNIDYNFQVLEDYVNTAVVLADGSVAMSGPLTLPGPGVSPNHAATVAQLGGVVPTGVIWDFGGDVAPAGWHICDFSVQSSTDPIYAPLWGVIGYKFGDAGGGNFKMPPPGRVYIGRDPAVPIFDTVGKTGGQRDSELLQHQHSTTLADHVHGPGALVMNDQGQHDHGMANMVLTGLLTGGSNAIPAIDGTTVTTWRSWLPQGLHRHTITGTSGGAGAAVVASTNQGAGTTHTDKNLPPYAVVTRIIKL